MVDDTLPFANTDKFYHQIGLFYFVWTRTDLVIDWALWKALKTATPEQAHERVAGLPFGRKCAKFQSLLLDSTEFKNNEKVKDLLARITNDSMRNVFAHSFLASDEGSVTFIHRWKEKRQYRVDRHTFTRAEFVNHVREFVQLSFDFQTAVGVSDWDLAGFAAAARLLRHPPPPGPATIPPV